MTRHLLSSVLILACGLFACKPRVGSRLQSTVDASTQDEQASLQIALTRGYASQSGLHANNHGAYGNIFDILGSYDSRTDDTGYGVWVDALIFFTEELHKRHFEGLTYEAIDPNVEHIIVGSQAVDFGFIIQSYLGRAHDQRSLCWNQVTCRSAITGLSALAEVASSLDDQEWQAYQQIFRTLDQTVASLSASTADQILELRASTLQSKAMFYRHVKFKDGYRPQWYYLQNDGAPVKNMVYQNLMSRLSKDIDDAETLYLRSDDPQRISPRTKYELISDIALSDVYDIQIIEGQQATSGQTLQPCANEIDCTQLLRSFSDVDREYIQQDIDLIAEEVVGDHIFNRAARFYLKRVMSGINDTRPWLRELEQKTRQWTDWVGMNLNQGPSVTRPANIEHISPTLALLMLNTFTRYEVWLPFRHEFRDTTLRLAQRTIAYSDFGQDRSMQTGALRVADAIKHQVDYVDRHVRQLGDQFDFGDLSLREKNIAILFPRDFHSFQSQVMEVYMARQRFLEMADFEQKRMQQQKHAQELSPAFQKSLFQRISEEVKMACINYAAGTNRSRFYNTGLEAQSTDGCWRVYFAGTGLDFELSQGLSGRLALGPLCQFSTDQTGRINQYPLSLGPISTRLARIDANGNMTRVCAQESASLNVQIASQAIGVALMPVMGGVSHVVLSRLGQMAATRAAAGMASRISGAATSRILATEIGKKLAASALGRLTAASVGKVGTVGMQSFLSASMFHFGTMAMLAPMGMAQAWDPNQSVASNLRIHAESIATMTLTFMLMRPVHAIAAKIAVPVAGSVPSELGRFAVPPMARSLAQRTAVRGIPFMATTLYFTEAHRLDQAVRAGSDLILGEMERMPHQDESYFKRFMHSAAMTLGFTLYGSMQTRWKNQPSEADYLLNQARLWRNQRIAPWSSEFPSLFNVFRTPDGQVRVTQTPEMLQTGTPPINPYKLFGIRMRPPGKRYNWQKDGTQWNAYIQKKYDRYVEKMQRAVKEAKDPESREVYQQFLDRSGLFQEVLTNPKLRQHYDQQLYKTEPYQQFYETNTRQAKIGRQ